MAIAITALQLLAYAVPANASDYVYLTSGDVQQMTTKDTATQAQEVSIDNFEVAQIVFPLDGWYDDLSSGYGYRSKACSSCSTFHQGADFPMPYGSPIRSIFIGKVVKTGYDGGLGEYIDIKYGDLNVTVTYAHLKGRSTKVKVGDIVQSGEVIGQVGATGTATVNHLHLGIWVDGYSLDPIVWLKAHHAKRYSRG